MYSPSKKHICTSILSILLLGHSQIANAVDATWTGALSMDWNTAGNWDPATVPDEAAIFDGRATSFFPKINAITPIETVRFLNIPKAYVIDVDGNGGLFSVGVLSVGNGVGFNNGILGTAALMQTVNVRNVGEIGFNQTSSADVGATGNITYNVDTLFSQVVGGVSKISFFDDSTAGKATINLGNFSLTRGEVDFNESSSAQFATINAYNNSLIQFNDSATPASSNLTANNSLINFSNTSTIFSSANISLSGGAALNFNDEDIFIASLNSANGGDLITLGTDSGFLLGIAGPSTGNVVNGKITGPGVIQFFGPGDMEITNPANDYAGTSISGGTFIATTDSLPSTGTTFINNLSGSPGTLEFNNTVDGTFTGTISNDGTILYTGPADITLSGPITGGGTFIVNAASNELCCDRNIECCGRNCDRLCDCRDTGSVTIDNPNTVLPSAQIKQGTLFIPLSQTPTLTTISPAGILNWTAGGVTSSNIVNDGKIIFSPTSTVGQISGIISGCGDLIQDGANSNLSLIGINTYTGRTLVQKGQLQVDVNTLPNKSAVTVDSGAQLLFAYSTNGEYKGDICNNGIVRVNGPGDTTLSGNIAGEGQLRVDSNTGDTFLFGCNTYEGGTDLLSGILHTRTQSLPTSGDRLVRSLLMLENNVCDVYPGTFNLIGTLGILEVASTADITLTGTMFGTGNLTINSPNQTITVLGNNTYTGETNIDAGTLATTTQSLPSPSTISISADGILKLINTTFDPLTGDDLSGTITNNGGLILYAGPSDAEISADISGTGGLEMNAPVCGQCCGDDTSPCPSCPQTNCCNSSVCSSCNSHCSTNSSCSSNHSSCNTCNSGCNSGCSSCNSGCKSNHSVCHTGGNNCASCNTGCNSNCSSCNKGCNNTCASCNSGCNNECSIPRLILSGTNTYSGDTVVTSGILQVDNQSFSPNSEYIIAPCGILDIAATGGTITSAIPIDNDGEVRVTGNVGTNVGFNVAVTGDGKFVSDIPGGNVTFQQTNTYRGGTVVENGNLVVTTTNLPVASTAPSVLVKNDGSLVFNQAFSGTYAGSILLCGPETQVVSNAEANTNVTLSGPITGTGAVLVERNFLALTNSGNSYCGGTTVNASAILQGNSGSLQGHITDNGTVIFNQTTDGTFCGNFSGTGSINKVGSGILTVCQDSPGFTGLTVVSEGTLNLNAILGGNVTVETELTGCGTILGNLSFVDGGGGPSSGEGCFNVGENLTINQGSSFTGTMTVGQNVNIVNSSSFTGSLTVGENLTINNSSSLEGEARVQGDVLVNNDSIFAANAIIGDDLSILNGSTFSPGGTGCIGKGIIGGDYEQDATSTLIVDIGACDCSDFINIAGDASLDGHLHFNLLEPFYNQCCFYEFMHVDGDLTGRFEDVTTNKRVFVPIVNYRDNSGSFDVLARFENIFNFIAKDCNQCVIGGQLACVIDPSSELQEVLDELIELGNSPDTIAQARHAYDQMTGMQYLTMMAANELAGHKFLRQLYDPIRSIVTNSEPHRVYYADPCCQSVYCEDRPCFSAWLEGGGGHTSINGNKCAAGAKINTYEILGGIQSRLNDCVTLGLAGGYVNDDIHYNIGGRGTNRTGFIGAYGLYRPCSWYVLGDLAYGYSRDSVRRPIHIGDELFFSAKSNPKVTQVLAYIEAGFDVPVCKFLIQPFLGFEGGFFKRRKVCETGAHPLDLVVSEKERSNIYSRLGLHLTTDGMCDKYAISVDLAWQCRLNNISSRIHERFKSFGNRFNIRGMDFTRNSFDGAATFTAFLRDNWELYVEVSGEKWSRASSYDVTGGVKFSW